MLRDVMRYAVITLDTSILYLMDSRLTVIDN